MVTFNFNGRPKKFSVMLNVFKNNQKVLTNDLAGKKFLLESLLKISEKLKINLTYLILAFSWLSISVRFL